MMNEDRISNMEVNKSEEVLKNKGNRCSGAVVIALSLFAFSPATEAISLFGTSSSTEAVAADQSTDSSALQQYLLGDVKKGPSADVQRRLIGEELALQDALIEEAKHKGLTKGKEFDARVELARRQIIVQRYWEDYFDKLPADEKGLRALYDKASASNGDRQYRLSQILVKDNEQAMTVLASLKKKESFADTAKKYSLETMTKERGGDLGWQWKANFVPQVAQTLAFLKTGEYTLVPVAVPAGLLIVRLDATRKQTFPTFDELKPQLMGALRQQAQQKELARLKSAM